jgi:hypothetical protein
MSLGSPMREKRLLVPKIIIFYLSMRRRPQQPSPQEEQKGTARPSAFETNDPESQSLASATTRHETMMQTYQTPSNKKMNVATTFEVQSGGPDGEAKPFSLCPRNYKQRKQLGFAIFCAIVLSVWHVHSKGKTQNKQTNKQTNRATLRVSFENSGKLCSNEYSGRKMVRFVHGCPPISRISPLVRKFFVPFACNCAKTLSTRVIFPLVGSRTRQKW